MFKTARDRDAILRKGKATPLGEWGWKLVNRMRSATAPGVKEFFRLHVAVP